MKNVNMVAEEKVNSLLEYRGALKDNDKIVFDKLVAYAKDHVNACAQADKLTLFESMLLAIIIEQQKKIEALSIGELTSG